MSKNHPHIAILGAGPAGVGAAFKLAKEKKAKVSVFELNNTVGGNSGSFAHKGLYLDYGSHRLHPSCDPEILNDIRELLGEELLIRPRHGRIRLQNRWIHFPLQPLDLLIKLPLNFSLGVAIDTLFKLFPTLPTSNGSSDTFESVLRKQLGKTICRQFYFPYVKKIWGIPPSKISKVQAQKRISANSFSKMVRKIFLKSKNRSMDGKPFFYYPRYGYGQISEALYHAACMNNAQFIFNARVKLVRLKENGAFTVGYEKNGDWHTMEADHVWSTLPISLLINSLVPQPPGYVLAAAEKIKLRAMILIYLFLDQPQFTEFDAHYFPGPDIPITRLSEPKNYSNASEPKEKTALCAELPANVNDTTWQMKDAELGRLVLKSLNAAGIPVKTKVTELLVRRIRHAYPIYERGYEKHFEITDKYLNNIPSLLSFGRQGLFVHDNTHHALYMAYKAIECLDQSGNFDKNLWHQYRKIFESHVVED